jgi:hypothetical protein
MYVCVCLSEYIMYILIEPLGKSLGYIYIYINIFVYRNIKNICTNMYIHTFIYIFMHIHIYRLQCEIIFSPTLIENPEEHSSSSSSLPLSSSEEPSSSSKEHSKHSEESSMDIVENENIEIKEGEKEVCIYKYIKIFTCYLNICIYIDIHIFICL